MAEAARELAASAVPHSLRRYQLPGLRRKGPKNLERQQQKKDAGGDTDRHGNANGTGGEPSPVSSEGRWICGREQSVIEAGWCAGRLPEAQQSPQFVVI